MKLARHRGMRSPRLAFLLLFTVVATGLELTVGADEPQILLSREVALEGTGESIGLFNLREGDGIEDAVASFALQVGLTAGEEASLLSSVHKEAISMRLVPLKSMDVTLPEGRKMSGLQIFEGDNVREAVLLAAEQAGVRDDEALVEELVHSVIKELKKDGIVPVLSLQVSVSDEAETVSLQMFDGDEVDDVVSKFVTSYGLNEGQAASLRDQVFLRRRMHGLDPLLELEVEFGDAFPPFRLFEQEVFDDAVTRYADANKLTAEQRESLRKDAARRGMEDGFLPYANVTVSLPAAATGLPGNSVSVLFRAKENATEVTKKFVAEHQLTQDMGTAILASAVKQGTELRILPALEFPVYAASKSPETDEGVMFQLFQGDNANQMVASFAEKHGLSKEDEERLLEYTMSLAKSSRLMPVVMLNVNVTEPGTEEKPGRRVPLSVPIYEGDSVATQAEATARAAELPEDVVAGFVDAAVAEGKRARLVPAIVFNISLDSEEIKIPAYMGDNVTEVGVQFAQSRALSEEDTSHLLSQLTLVAMREKLLPMLSIPVSVTQNDGETGATNTTKVVLEVYHGENIEEAVDKFLKSVEASEEDYGASRKTLLEKATREAYDVGLLALMEVPVTISGKERAVKVFKGDSPLQSVERFLASLPTGALPADWSETDKESLVKLIDAEARELRLLPVMQLEVQAGDQLIPLYIFKGDNITGMVENMTAKLNLSPEDSAILEQQVVSKAQARRLVPKLTVPVQMEDGKTEDLFLFEGDSVKEAVVGWGKAHGLPDEQLVRLESSVKARATMERVIPALRFAMDVAGARQELQLFSGDNITNTVHAFVEKHGMGGDSKTELIKMVSEKALDARLMPEYVIPVEIEGGASQGNADLLIFRGDNVETVANQFAEEHHLTVDRIQFVASVWQSLAHLSTSTAAKRDEL